MLRKTLSMLIATSILSSVALVNNQKEVSAATLMPKSIFKENKEKNKVYYRDINWLIKRMDKIALEISQARFEIEKQIKKEQEEAQLIADRNARKEMISFNEYDVTKSSNITANELYQVLSNFKNGALAKYAWVIKDCEDIYGINSFFLAGIIALESGWDQSPRANGQNNLTGHAVYNSSATGSTFNSKEDSIYATAKLLRNNFVTPGAISYNTSYCLDESGTVPDYNWSSSIISIANDFVNYYHSNVKQLEEVPVVNTDVEELLKERKKEILLLNEE